MGTCTPPIKHFQNTHYKAALAAARPTNHDGSWWALVMVGRGARSRKLAPTLPLSDAFPCSQNATEYVVCRVGIAHQPDLLRWAVPTLHCFPPVASGLP